MKKFKVTLLVPQVSEIEATDIQDAHRKVKQMMLGVNTDENPHPKVHAIEEIALSEFGPSPAE